MREEIFRKKSLDKVKSPDNLSDYVRVAGTGVWLIVVAVIILLVGALVWANFSRIETTIDLEGDASAGVLVCDVPNSKISKIEEGMVIRVGDTEGTVTDIDKKEGTLTADIDVYNGTHSAEVVTASIRPLSLIFD